jgi:hypothetical protein
MAASRLMTNGRSSLPTPVVKVEPTGANNAAKAVTVKKEAKSFNPPVIIKKEASPVKRKTTSGNTDNGNDDDDDDDELPLVSKNGVCCRHCDFGARDDKSR